MKQSKMKLLFAALIVGLAIPSFAQKQLPEVTITSVRYKYLSAVDNKEIPQPVKLLERQAAEYDVKKSEYYSDDYDQYSISFFIPAGYILATYDADGKLLRTAEKFQNVALPPAVSQAVAKKFPLWSITKDVYLVTYEQEKGATKTWKLLLQNGDKRLKIKTNENGDIIK